MRLRSAARRDRSTAAASTTIDHSFYPHIIDDIWSYLSVEGLRNIRATCKAWMVRADLSLSNHIIIEKKSESAYDVYARCLAHPGVQQSITEQFRDSCSCTFSFGVEYDGGQDGSVCLACNRLLDIPTIDAVGYNPITADPSIPPFDMIPGNATLRWPNFAHETEAHWSLEIGYDQVFWLQHDGIENVGITFDLDQEALYNAPDPIELVFNFECLVSPTSGTALTQLHIPAWQELECKGCLTFIFHDMRVNAKKPPPLNPAFIVGLLQCYTAAGISVTLVGLESFIKTSRGWKRYEESVFSGFLNYRTEVMDSDGTEDYEEVCEAEWEELVRFLTMEEYEEAVGHERFLIHTMK